MVSVHFCLLIGSTFAGCAYFCAFGCSEGAPLAFPCHFACLFGRTFAGYACFFPFCCLVGAPLAFPCIFACLLATLLPVVQGFPFWVARYRRSFRVSVHFC